MPCKIFLRHDQSATQIPKCQMNGVVVYGPSWVREALEILGEKLKGIEFNVFEKPSRKRGRNSSGPPKSQVVDSFRITQNFNDGNLVLLQRVARNETKNINGATNLTHYLPNVKEAKLVYSLKDLARQTVIVGKDVTTHCGGYRSDRVPQKDEPVYICDLAAIQFNRPYNSGRLVLIQESDPFKGPLDDFIFEHVVGEKRTSFQELSSYDEAEISHRYVKHPGYGNSRSKSCFFDKTAYRKFVANDVLLSGLALADIASKKGHKLNFKFLKYGTGYFAGKFKDLLDSLILTAVVDGLEKLFETNKKNVLETIRFLEFPFYTKDDDNVKRLTDLKNRYNINFQFSREDALKQTMYGTGLITATTNCADTNVACGNAMGFKSTDGAISENLVSKGNIFCPNMNHLIDYKYVDVEKVYDSE